MARPLMKWAPAPGPSALVLFLSPLPRRVCQGTHTMASVRAELLLPPRGGLCDGHLKGTAPVTHARTSHLQRMGSCLASFMNRRKGHSSAHCCHLRGPPILTCSAVHAAGCGSVCVTVDGVGTCRMGTDTSTGLQGLPGRSCFLLSWRFGCLLEQEPMSTKASEELHDITGSSCLLSHIPHGCGILKSWHHPHKSVGVWFPVLSSARPRTLPVHHSTGHREGAACSSVKALCAP